MTNNPYTHGTCPLCGEVLEYKPYPAGQGYENKSATHIWVCTICPFVGLEFYSFDNISDLAEALGNEEDLVHPWGLEKPWTKEELEDFANQK